MPKLIATRALTAHIARRFVRLASLIATAIFASVVLLCTLLSYFLSAWWWLLIIPFVLVFGIFLLIRTIVLFIVRKIHSQTVTNEQKYALDQFTSKLERLVEARGTPPIIFVFITIKDLLIHHDITTIKELVRDTTSLQRDFADLQKQFD